MNATSSRVQALMNKVPTSVVDMIVKLNQEMEAARHLDNTFAQVADILKFTFQREDTTMGDEVTIGVNEVGHHHGEQILLAVDDEDTDKTICCTMRVTMMNEDCTRFKMECSLQTRMADVPIVEAILVTVEGSAKMVLACVTCTRDEVKSYILGKNWMQVLACVHNLRDD